MKNIDNICAILLDTECTWALASSTNSTVYRGASYVVIINQCHTATY